MTVWQTHFDLLDIVRTDLTRLGFPQRAYQALTHHEAEFKYGEDRKDAEWFNVAANYLAATERVLQCKLKACSDVLVDASITDLALRESAVKILLDPSDGLALQHGINFIVKQELLEQYNTQLLEVCKSPLLNKLSLDLKGAGLTGTMCVCQLIRSQPLLHTLYSLCTTWHRACAPCVTRHLCQGRIL